MKKFLTLLLSLSLVACGGGGGGSNTSSTSTASASSMPTFPCVTLQAIPDGKYRSVIIDVPHEYTDTTSRGLATSSFENVKLSIDRAKCVGFNTAIFQTFIPIDPTTGLLVGAIGSDLPRDYWRIVDYAKQQGLKVVAKMVPSDYRNDDILYDTSYPNVPVVPMLSSLNQYYQTLAIKAEEHHIDVMYIGYFQMGFDTLAYRPNWQSIINNVKSVYSGKITYATCWQCTNNIVWDLVDIVSVDFEPTSTPSCSATVSQILPYYQQPINAVNAVYQTYHKPIWLDEMDFETTGCNYVGTGTYRLLMSGQLTSSYAPDYSWQSNNIRAVFEMSAVQMNGAVSGLVFGMYLPWMQAEWIQRPTNATGIMFNLFDKLGYSLYNNDQAQFTLEEYLGKPWGYHIFY